MTEEQKIQAAQEAAEEKELSEAEVTGEEPAEAAEEAGEKEDAPRKEKKGFFSRSDKVDKLEKALQESDEKVKALTDKVQRNMAEFDNYRKRTEKEKAAMYDIGARKVLEKLLPVVDSFERGLGGLSEEQKAEPFAAGMDLVYKQTLKMLDELDVKPIEAVGQPFDPDKHNAVMHVEDDSVGENIVVAEFQKGYTYHDIVIRYSMVQVAN